MKIARVELLLILSLLFCMSSSHTLFGQELTNIRAVTNKGASYSKPQWSPDGTKLMFTTEHNKGIYILTVNEKKLQNITNLDFVGYNATWDNDGKSISIQEKKQSDMDNSTYFHTQRLDVATGKVLSTDKVAAKQIISRKVISNANKNTATNPIEAYINDALQLVVVRDGNSQVLTKDSEGQFYHPLISPDCTRVVVHKKGMIYMYSLTDTTEFPIKLGEGIASGWLPDSTSIVSFMDDSTDGHTISNSELYKMSVNKRVQLTSSKELAEMWPNVSPDGKQLAFSDENSGQIYIADLTN